MIVPDSPGMVGISGFTRWTRFFVCEMVTPNTGSTNGGISAGDVVVPSALRRFNLLNSGVDEEVDVSEVGPPTSVGTGVEEVEAGWAKGSETR